MSRVLDAPDAVSVNALVFSGGEVWSDDEPDAQASAIVRTLAQSVPGPPNNPNESSRPDEERNISTYVRAFEDMVSTVIREESHTLSDEEFALLTVFAHLSYNARFLMVKLLLRKQETWHRLDTLKYEGELGSVSAIVEAIEELCQVGSEPSDTIKKEPEERGIVDLPVGDGIAHVQHAGVLEPSSGDKPLTLARCEREMDLRSLLECLRMDELKVIAKQLKIKANPKKDDLVNGLLDASSSQSTLAGFSRRDDTKQSEGCGYHQTKLSFNKLRPQQDRLKEIVLNYIVKCVRVDGEFFGVIHRVNLVYFRLTQYTPCILVAALLTRFGKRAYPGYKYERTRNIWPSRQALLDYEEVLILEGQVDALLAGNVPILSGRAAGCKTHVSRFSLTPVTPGHASGNGARKDPTDEDMETDVKPDSIRMQNARVVKDIFERVYPCWQDLVKTKCEEGGRATGLDRFHYGHVLTRIICKGTSALGILGEHERELDVLEALLAQNRWRRGQRGKWYERRALILSTHFPKDEETTERALDAVMEALIDPDTHIACRPKLQRRLRRLENKLRIPIKDRHTCDGILAVADEVVFEAVRLKHRAASLKLDRTGRCTNATSSQKGNQNIKRYYSPATTSVKSESSSSVVPPPCRGSPPDVPKGKSLWLGQNGEELTVEALALQRYGEQGFRGVHCETRVISMLFALLFWDIIFESIPGAFETPYQTAPLDIAEDSFYHSRKDAMEKRLTVIEDGKGADLIRVVDAEHRISETWCVGVRWDLFSSEDLVDIVSCIGGKALSVICRVLCEDYTFGTSGGPDLFLWNAENGTCKFVEVKGPGDTLQENQRVWIDILLKAPVDVEICRVVESGDEAERKPNTRTPKTTGKKAKKTPKKHEVQVEAEDADALPNMLEILHATSEGQLALTGASPSLGPVDFGIVASLVTAVTPSTGTSNRLKRRASPPGIIPPTPSKRPRVS